LAADQLKGTLLVFDAFHDAAELYTKQGNKDAKDVLESWANAEWFQNKPPVPEKSRESFLRCQEKRIPMI
jgi:aconitate hydratase 2/2-methylisocitrate dehydratase